MDNRPIGVFDSGVGGLTVLKEMKRILPAENFIYVGDTARVPYGVKSRSTITKFASQIMDFLMEKDVKLIVVACNTVSSNSLSYLKSRYRVPVIGVIEPGVQLALDRTKNRCVGIIGTQSTIRSHKYKELIIRQDRKIRIFEKACPLFVPLVEELLFDHSITRLAIKGYLQEFRARKIDTLVLGCTHYPLLTRALNRFFQGKVNLISSGYSVSLVVQDILSKKRLFSGRRKKGSIHLYASDLNENFRKLSRVVLSDSSVKMQLISFD
ncbi:MAG: glutamate racemase [bacterium]|nr:glutamate racemase [bacterium]